MKNNSAVRTAVLSSLLTAIVVGGIVYYLSAKGMLPIAIEKGCYKQYDTGTFTFEYPCDWRTDVSGGTTWTQTGTVVSPDGKASFIYPAPDIGLHDAELVEQKTIIINGKSYLIKSYRSGEMDFSFIEYTGTDGYSVMINSEGGAYQDELVRILSSISE